MRIILFSPPVSIQSDLCQVGANDGVTELVKYCKSKPNEPEHRLLTGCNDLQSSLTKLFNKAMQHSWDRNIRPDGAFKTDCSRKPDIEVVPSKDPVTGIVSMNLTGTTEMGVQQKSQSPSESLNSYQFIARAVAKVHPGGSIGCTNCYTLSQDDASQTEPEVDVLRLWGYKVA